MPRRHLFDMSIATIYPLYVAKAERKNRSKDEVDQVISWLTGYDVDGLERSIAADVDLRTFFDQAPAMNPRMSLITGTVCGIRVEQIEDPLMQRIRYLDKLVDELAKGRPMQKVLRGGGDGPGVPAAT